MAKLKFYDDDNNSFGETLLITPPNEFLSQVAKKLNYSLENLKWVIAPKTIFRLFQHIGELKINSLVNSRKDAIERLHLDLAVGNLNQCINLAEANLEASLELSLPDNPTNETQKLTGFGMHADFGVHVPEDYLAFNQDPFPTLNEGDSTPTYEEAAPPHKKTKLQM